MFFTHTFLDYRAVQPYKLPASLNIIIIRHQLGFDRYVSASSDSPLLKGLPSRLRPLRLERIKYYFQNSKSLNNATNIRCTHVRSVGKMQGFWMVKQAVYIVATLLRRVNKLCWTELNDNCVHIKAVVIKEINWSIIPNYQFNFYYWRELILKNVKATPRQLKSEQNSKKALIFPTPQNSGKLQLRWINDALQLSVGITLMHIASLSDTLVSLKIF